MGGDVSLLSVQTLQDRGNGARRNKCTQVIAYTYIRATSLHPTPQLSPHSTPHLNSHLTPLHTSTLTSLHSTPQLSPHLTPHHNPFPPHSTPHLNSHLTSPHTTPPSPLTPPHTSTLTSPHPTPQLSPHLILHPNPFPPHPLPLLLGPQLRQLLGLGLCPGHVGAVRGEVLHEAVPGPSRPPVLLPQGAAAQAGQALGLLLLLHVGNDPL